MAGTRGFEPLYLDPELILRIKLDPRCNTLGIETSDEWFWSIEYCTIEGAEEEADRIMAIINGVGNDL